MLYLSAAENSVVMTLGRGTILQFLSSDMKYSSSLFEVPSTITKFPGSE